MITLGSGTLGIGLAINLRDQFTAKSNAISSSFNQLYGNANRVMRDNLVVARKVGLGMGVMGALMTTGFGKGLRAAADYEYVMKTVQLTSNATVQQMKILDDLAVSLGTSTQFKPQQVASAMEYLIKAGFEAKHVIDGTIQSVVYLGAALDKSIEGKGGVADYLSHIMQGFGIGPKGAMRVADMVTQAALASSGDLEDIHEALKYVSSTAVDLHIGMDETLAMIAKLSNAGLRGGIGGRSLNNMFVQLATSLSQLRSPKHEKIFEIMGLNPSDLMDSAGNLKRVSDVLGILNSRFKSMGSVERTGVLSALFNLRGGRAFEPLVRTGGVGKSYSELLGLVRASSGLAERIAKERMDTLWGSFERFGDVTWNFFKTIGAIIEPLFRPVLDLTTRLISKITTLAQSWWGKPLVILAAFTAVALTGLGGLIVAFTTVKLLSIASTFTFGNMGRSLQLAWSQGIAGALRYATVAKGAMMVNTPMGVRWRNMATGRFVQGATAATVGGAVGQAARAGGLWAMFTRGLTFGANAISQFVRVIKGGIGTMGGVVAILGAFVGFRSMLKLVVFGLGTLLNSIIFVAHSIWAIVGNILTPGKIPEDLQKAGKRWSNTQENLIESLGMRKLTGQASFKGAEAPGKLQGFEDWMTKFKATPSLRPINLTMSGKKVGEITDEERRRDIISQMSTKPLN